MASKSIFFNTASSALSYSIFSPSSRSAQPQSDQRCIEILNSDGSGGTGGSVLGGETTPRENSPLRVTLSGGQQVEVGQSTIVRAEVSNSGSEPIDGVRLTNRFAPSYYPLEITEEFLPRLSWVADDEFIVDVGRVNPGETVAVDVRYEARQVDPSAGVVFTASSNAGGNSAELPVPIAAQGSLGGSNQGGSGIAVPDFGGSGDGSITIPNNGNGTGQGGIGGQGGQNGQGQPGSGGAGAGTQGDLQVVVQAIDQNIRLGQPARVRFSVTNNRLTPINNVRVQFIPYNSLSNIEVIANNNLDLVGQFEFEPIRTLRSGETYTFDVVGTGQIAGLATLEVQAISDDTVGVSSSTDTISISQ